MKFTGERVVIGDMKSQIPTLQQHIARYNIALGPAVGKRVLDAACGTGYGTKMLQEAAKSVVGADISQEACEYASKLYSDIKFQTVNLDKAFPRGKFDLCVSFETIEHLDSPEVFLRNVKNNCKELLFSIPVNNPSQYHKQVWGKEEIIKNMNKYWKHITWYNQNGVNIYNGVNDATFLIGHAIGK